MGESLSPDFVLQLLERIATLEARVVELEAQLAAAKKNSRNSSKPPSSDIVKPPPSRGKGKRRIGGQPGHEPHFRTAFIPEQLDEVHIFNPPSPVCRHCGGRFESLQPWAKFCSNNCRSAARRASRVDDETRVCVVCGKSFRTNRYLPTRTCSASCAYRSRSD